MGYIHLGRDRRPLDANTHLHGCAKPVFWLNAKDAQSRPLTTTADDAGQVLPPTMQRSWSMTVVCPDDQQTDVPCFVTEPAVDCRSTERYMHARFDSRKSSHVPDKMHQYHQRTMAHLGRRKKRMKKRIKKAVSAGRDGHANNKRETSAETGDHLLAKQAINKQTTAILGGRLFPSLSSSSSPSFPFPRWPPSY